MSKNKAYSNFELDRLKKEVKEMSDIYFKVALKDSKYDSFLCKESFEKYKVTLWRLNSTKNKIQELLEKLKDNE
jgi:hypothetical protein